MMEYIKQKPDYTEEKWFSDDATIEATIPSLFMNKKCRASKRKLVILSYVPKPYILNFIIFMDFK